MICMNLKNIKITLKDKKKSPFTQYSLFSDTWFLKCKKGLLLKCKKGLPVLLVVKY